MRPVQYLAYILRKNGVITQEDIEASLNQRKPPPAKGKEIPLPPAQGSCAKLYERVEADVQAYPLEVATSLAPPRRKVKAAFHIAKILDEPIKGQKEMPTAMSLALARVGLATMEEPECTKHRDALAEHLDIVDAHKPQHVDADPIWKAQRKNSLKDIVKGQKLYGKEEANG